MNSSPLTSIKKYHSMLLNATPKTLGLSLKDVHADGMFSLVINGTKPGKLTRVFIADKKLRPYDVQLHTHRYPIQLTAITGGIRHYNATLLGDHQSLPMTPYMSMFSYRSPLNGGNGLSYEKDIQVEVKDFMLPIGSQIHLSHNDFHTMTCGKGSMWIVEELGFVKDHSLVLGVPFMTQGLYNKPDMYQINDKAQLVSKVLCKIIESYNTVELNNESQ